jgi:hypothetical protein
MPIGNRHFDLSVLRTNVQKMNGFVLVLILLAAASVVIWAVVGAIHKNNPRTADLDKGVHNLPKVLTDLESMSESDLRWLQKETRDNSAVDIHTAAQTRIIHRRIRQLLGDDAGLPKLGYRPTVENRPAEQHRPPHGYVYLLKMYGVTKVGITLDVERRMKEHRRNGWKQVRVWKVRDIDEAKRIEKSCLHIAASLGTLLTDEQLRAIMPQGGYTEVTRMSPEHLERLIDEQVNP